MSARRASTTRPGSPWRLRGRALLALGPLVSLSWMGAHAAFTDAVDANSTFTTGTIDLQVNGSDTAVAFTSLALTDALPGAVTYGGLTVRNNGASAFTYALGTTVTGSSALSSVMTVGITRLAAGATCDATAYAGATTTLSTEAAGLTGAAFSGRTLAAGTSEVLCFKVTLPAGVANTLQGTSSTATFALSATN